MSDTNYYIYALCLCIVVVLFFVWQKTKNLTHDDVLILNSYKFPSLEQWYINHAEPTLPSFLQEEEIAKDYIETLHKLSVNKEDLVIGLRLKEKYKKIYEKNKELLKHVTSVSDQIKFFDLRSEIGLPGEIAIIPNKEVRNLLYKIRINKKDLYDSKEYYNDIIKNNELYWIRKVNKKFYPILYTHTTSILQERWEKLNHLFQDHLFQKTKKHKSVFVIKNNKERSSGQICDQLRIIAKEEDYGSVINMLCSNKEFDTLVNRFEAYISNTLL
jgi:hypothetical protein